MNFGMPKTAFKSASTATDTAHNEAIKQAQRRVEHYQKLLNQFGSNQEVIQAHERAMRELERLQDA
jgi:hemin uptake protein HemP